MQCEQMCLWQTLQVCIWAMVAIREHLWQGALSGGGLMSLLEEAGSTGGSPLLLDDWVTRVSVCSFSLEAAFLYSQHGITM